MSCSAARDLKLQQDPFMSCWGKKEDCTSICYVLCACSKRYRKGMHEMNRGLEIYHLPSNLRR
jgi:hypothetical protein